MCELLFLLSALLACPLISAFNKTVGFKKEDCEGRRNLYNSDDIYNVVWDGEEYPQFCSLNFKIISSDSYELCAKVTQFNLECPDFKLKFYWGVKMNEKYLTNNDTYEQQESQSAINQSIDMFKATKMNIKLIEPEFTYKAESDQMGSPSRHGSSKSRTADQTVEFKEVIKDLL
ncbi:unnamed protein product [Mytilus edulis]|uniref:Uncharacterized protein n=1 Tax=Mytilus edulis TaxID=6550 RepID=A0A8S3S9V4_MYTED|nr:unnamed protein product [Mytilus edulis]